MGSRRWGIAGFGWVARDYMAPAIEAAGGTVVAVADPSPIAQASAESASIVAYDDAATMLGGTECDILYVATPNNLHADAVRAAASAGVPVLCEKPMAASLADAEAIADAVAASGVLYGTAFDQRHHPAHAVMRDRIAAGAVGTPTAIRIVYAAGSIRSGPRTASAATIGARTRRRPAAGRSSTWRCTGSTSPRCCSASLWSTSTSHCNGASTTTPSTTAAC